MNRRLASCSPIGLDAGQAAVRAAQLVGSSGGWAVTTLVGWPVPRGRQGVLQDRTVMDRAARYLRRSPFRGRHAVAGLSTPHLELHAMQLADSTSSRQRREFADAEIQRLMSYHEQSVQTDYWSLPESPTMTSTAIGLAAPHAVLNDLISFCRLAKLDCSRVDATACALTRFGSLYRGLSPEQEDVWGLLDLGGRMSRLILCVHETPVLGRAFEYGGESWTKKLASALEVSEETAERHKCDHGIAQIARNSPDTSADGQTTQVVGEMNYNVLRDDLKAILGEVERSYRYVMHCFPGRKAGPLILVGGGARMCNLDRLMAERLGIDVFVPAIDNRPTGCRLSFDRVANQMREPLAVFACAIGLAVPPE